MLRVSKRLYFNTEEIPLVKKSIMGLGAGEIKPE